MMDIVLSNVLLGHIFFVVCHPGDVFRCGYHGKPSLEPLHFHIVSQDFTGERMRKVYHWNSFTTGDAGDATADTCCCFAKSADSNRANMSRNSQESLDVVGFVVWSWPWHNHRSTEMKTPVKDCWGIAISAAAVAASSAVFARALP